MVYIIIVVYALYIIIAVFLVENMYIWTKKILILFLQLKKQKQKKKHYYKNQFDREKIIFDFESFHQRQIEGGYKLPADYRSIAKDYQTCISPSSVTVKDKVVEKFFSFLLAIDKVR